MTAEPAGVLWGTDYMDEPAPYDPDLTGRVRQSIAPTHAYLSSPANASAASILSASTIPLQRAEELLTSLPGVISARIMADGAGSVSEIHVLTSLDVAPKQTVRNIESALIAHLGMRVDHRKISVATTMEPPRPHLHAEAGGLATAGVADGAAEPVTDGRRLYFEDVEVRRSRSRGVSCRVTLRKGEASYCGEAEGMENERSRVDLAARATLQAIVEAEGMQGRLSVDGVQIIPAFGREFVFVAIAARMERMNALLTGTCETRDSLETAGALAVLDATNRWLAHGQ